MNTRTYLAFGAIRIDPERLERMGQGDRVDAIRALGSILRRFSPEAADLLETYDGALHEAEPFLLAATPATAPDDEWDDDGPTWLGREE